MFYVMSIVLILLIIFVLLIIFWTQMINLRDYIYLRRKSSTFECGFEIKDQSRQPFSLRFFLIIIVFLIFDIELCLLLKLPLVKFLYFYNCREFFLIIFIILIIGILEEWRRGLLVWK